MVRIAAPASLLALVVASLPLAHSGPGDVDNDLYPDAAETLLGTSPYWPADRPVDVGVNAVTNPGFEIRGRPAQDAAACPAVGDQSFTLLGLVAVSPCHQSLVALGGWSNGQLLSTQVVARPVDTDGDGDLEMAVPAGAPALNFYQTWLSSLQAFSASFTWLTFQVEVNGFTPAMLPPGAVVVANVTLTPFNDASLWVPNFVECGLVFTAPLLQEKAQMTSIPGPGGKRYLHVAIDPVRAPLQAYWSGCAEEAAQYAGADDTTRRAILGSMRLMQLSFYGFQGAVIDNVDLRGSKAPLGFPDRTPEL